MASIIPTSHASTQTGTKSQRRVRRATVSDPVLTQTQTLLQLIATDLYQATAFYRLGDRRFAAAYPFHLCRKLSELHLRKLERTMQRYNLDCCALESASNQQAFALSSELHAACYDGLKLAITRDEHYREWLLTCEQNNLESDIQQLLTNIERGIHDRCLPAFKQFLEHCWI